MAAKDRGKTIFGKKCQMTVFTLGGTNFVEIPLSRTIPEMNAFYIETQDGH